MSVCQPLAMTQNILSIKHIDLAQCSNAAHPTSPSV